MCLVALGVDGLGDLVDARSDDAGLLLDRERLPKLIRINRGRNWRGLASVSLAVRTTIGYTLSASCYFVAEWLIY